MLCSARWDICLIDCPPSLGLLTVNALVAARNVLVPLQCEFFALEGLEPASADGRANPSRVQSGALDPRRRADDVRPPQQSLAGSRRRTFARALGSVVFETVVPRNVRLSEAPSHGLPGVDLRS